MKFEIVYTREALKALRRMPRNIATLLAGKIDRLSDGGEALAPNIKKLQARDGYRLRVGDYRVIYTIDHGRLIITIIKVGTRGDIYE